MRRIHIGKGDFALFHQDISAIEYEFFRNHDGAFKRMWNEQTRSFWIVFVDMFDHFIWNYGVMKDFPLKIDEVHRYVEEIISLITLSFIEGNASSAKTLISECATVAQNRHYIGTLDKASYAQNPFYIKDTREAFRKLFGMPRSKTTFMKVLCGLPVYVKFAGSIVTLLRRWLSSDNLEDSSCIDSYLSQLTSIRANDKASLEAIERALAREKRRVETEKTTKKVSKKHFANEGTKQKALEWIDDSKASSSVVNELEELDPPPGERRSYKSEYKKAIQSVTEDVRNSLVESIAEVKRKEIELAREKGEDVDHLIEEFKEDLAKRKRPRRKRRKRGGGEEGDDEISSLMALHKEVSSSDRYLEAIGAKRPQGSLLPPCITEVNDTDDENDPINKEKVAATAASGLNKESDKTTSSNGESNKGKELVPKQGKEEKCADNQLSSSDSVQLPVEVEKNDIAPPEESPPEESPTELSVEKEECNAKSPTGTEECTEEKKQCNHQSPIRENVQVALESVSIDSVSSLSSDSFGSTEEKELASQNIEQNIEKENDLKVKEIAQNDVTLSQQQQVPTANTSIKTIDTKPISNHRDECDSKRKLHVCSYCRKKEEVAKSFKRCVKCRGKPNPHYYCSKSCQVNEWKAGHRLDHKDDED